MKEIQRSNSSEFPFEEQIIRFAKTLFEALVPYRRIIVLGIQVFLIGLSNYLAFLLRFDGNIPEAYLQVWRGALVSVLLLRTLTFIPFRLYEGLWRYSGIHDLRNIVSGTFVSTMLLFCLQITTSIPPYPKTVYVIDSLLLISLLGGIRLGRRFQRELRRTNRKSTVLVYGAGDAGEMIVRDMKNNPFYDKEPIGFIDDDKRKIGQRIHGVPVLGTRLQLASVLEKVKPSEILIAMPKADPAMLRSVLTALRSHKIPIKTLPSLRDVFSGKVTLSHIRDLRLEDLLPRVPIGLDQLRERRLIAGKRVMITGAGGSIGSELARQVSAMAPASIILFERYENTLYEILNELHASYPKMAIQGIVGDVGDVRRVSEVMSTHSPEIVFHAAAHKHVPLMEHNPCEAIKNNVRGTRVMIEAAKAFGIRKFVLISTDKAVNPTSIMGASKKVAELLAQTRTVEQTAFITVRFGNVLGSNGSVVPLFLQQIKKGGPVTVTHPDMKRYFMLIPEAVQLVLQAAAIGDSGSIYVLDMGNDFTVLELARNLIRLCGFVPEEEIAIEFIGLRPGEKLNEELVAVDEVAEESIVARIAQVKPRTALPSKAFVDACVAGLEEQASREDTSAVLYSIRQLVPNYHAEDCPSITKMEASASVGRAT